MVTDGGGLMRARNEAATLAQEAARAGVQQLDWSSYREGTNEVALDPSAASAAAQSFLNAAGATGTVAVSGDTVTVTCSVDYSFTLLPMGSTTVDATATARPHTQPTP
nr:hypothetical protein [Nocardiopsis dassonvillei]